MTTDLEVRTVQGLEIRAESGAPPRLVGYAAVFNSRSFDLGGFVEIVRPGAFSRSLRGADVRALVEHDPGRIIGRNRAKTLTLGEDERGLKVEITPPDTQAGRDVVESVRRGDLDGMSFGFRTVKHRWTFDEDPKQPALRELLDVDLFDVSVVAFPAYPKTDVGLRGLEAARTAWASGEAARSLETARRRVRMADLLRNA
jgi:HK97 family phage prohead protease